MKPKMASFRIRRIYYDQIVSGEKTEELRSNTPFWRQRLLNPHLSSPEVAVFVCGKNVHRRWITGIHIDEPERVLGRPLSSQGQRDISTDSVIVIELGKIYEVTEEV